MLELGRTNVQLAMCRAICYICTLCSLAYNIAVYKITAGHRSISDHFTEMTAQIVAWSVLPSDHIPCCVSTSRKLAGTADRAPMERNHNLASFPGFILGTLLVPRQRGIAVCMRIII